MTPPHIQVTAALADTLRFVCLRTDKLIGAGVSCSLGVLEETITDINLIDVALRHPRFVSTRKFNRIEEGTVTGADWLWVIGGPGRWLPILVQAKLVDTRTKKCIGFRQKLSNGRLQYDLLVNFAKSQRFFPLYCVYNWTSDPDLPPFKTDCIEGESDLRYLGCVVVLPGNVNAFNQRWRHATHREIVEQGHSLACLLRDEHSAAHHGSPPPRSAGLADTVAAAIDRYREAVRAGAGDDAGAAGADEAVDDFPRAADLIVERIPRIVEELMQAPDNDPPFYIRHLLIMSDRELQPVDEINRPMRRRD